MSSATLTVKPDGASLARDIGALFADSINVLDYEAAVDGITDDRAALLDASAVAGGAKLIVIPAGVTGQFYMASSAAVPGPVFLMGAEIGANPLYSGKLTAGFSDKNWFLRADRNAGAYAGTPVTYTYVDDLAGVLQRFNNAAGYQQYYTSDGGGRTQIAANLLYASHQGYGDLTGWFASIGISKHPNVDSATSWTGRNSVTLFAGQVGAVTDKVNIYGAEYAITDNGNASVAALGVVLNFKRTASQTVGYRTPWLGIRVQSPLSTERLDAIFQGQGAWRVGLDLTAVSFDPATESAIALTRGQRIYFDADASAAPANWYAGDGNSLGEAYLSGNESGGVSVHGGFKVESGCAELPAQTKIGEFIYEPDATGYLRIATTRVTESGGTRVTESDDLRVSQ